MDAIGLRATATDGLILKDVLVPDEYSLVIPGAFTRMMQMSRGSFVGNQIAGIAVYLGGAQAVFDYVIDFLTTKTFRDTGTPHWIKPYASRAYRQNDHRHGNSLSLDAPPARA